MTNVTKSPAEHGKHSEFNMAVRSRLDGVLRACDNTEYVLGAVNSDLVPELERIEITARQRQAGSEAAASVAMTAAVEAAPTEATAVGPNMLNEGEPDAVEQEMYWAGLEKSMGGQSAANPADVARAAIEAAYGVAEQ